MPDKLLPQPETAEPIQSRLVLTRHAIHKRCLLLKLINKIILRKKVRRLQLKIGKSIV